MGESFGRPIRIETARCILSEMRVSDAEYWYRFMSDPRVYRYLPDRLTSPSEMEDTLKWLSRNYATDSDHATRITLSITLRTDSAALVGWVTYGPLPEDEDLREVGYAVAPELWGRGIATEASRAFMHWVFRQVTIDRLYATVDTANGASVRVLEKLGMRPYQVSGEATLRALPGHALYVVDRTQAKQDAE